MGVKFTDEQQKVIDTRGCNLLVSAAAGSGKTAVLVERVITRLTKEKPPLNVDQLLVVTFTDAAAAEMKVRIREAIEKALESQPGNEHLQRQAALIHRAQISTIHTFCTSVINEHFHALDLDPSVRVGETGEIELIKHDALEQVIEKAYENGDPDFLNLVECYAQGKTDEPLEELVLRLYKDSRSHPIPEAWLDMCVQQYIITSIEELEDKSYIRDIIKDVKKRMGEWKQELERAVALCYSEEGPSSYGPALQTDLMQVEKIVQTESFTKMQELVSAFVFQSLAGKKKSDVVDAEKQNQVKDIRAKFKAYHAQIFKEYFEETLEEIQISMGFAHRQAKALVTLVKQFSDCFAEEKKKKNVIDFNDMEHFALRILTKEENGVLVPSDIAKGYQAKFEEIMIDEYQDINVLQDTIMASVSGVRDGKNNLFMVGDVKQSIYRFRLSCPDLFMHKYHQYAKEGKENCRIDLHMNFRSRREVLESTNFVFEQLMSKEFGGIVYDQGAALHVGAQYKESENHKTEVLLLDLPDTLAKRRREVEAQVIANKISELVGKYEVYDKKLDGYRKARYGDVAILYRGLGVERSVYLETLNEADIPVRMQSKEGYFQAYEIQSVLNYLRILDNPRQDIPYTAVLTSLFGKFTAEELAKIRNCKPKVGMHECVEEYAEKGTDEALKEKVQTFLRRYVRFRKMVATTPMHTLLWRLSEESGFLDCMAVFPNGEQRVANLEMLIEKATSFERSSYKGLFNFVRYIEQLEKYQVENGPANLVDEQMNAVTLMTVHKSKGLEFPIVFLIQCGKDFVNKSAQGEMILHQEMGIGLKAIDPVRRLKSRTLLQKVISRRIMIESAEEESRLLYVAMTRAREKLFLLGDSKNMSAKIESLGLVRNWEENVLPYHLVSNAKSYLDWILLALYRNMCMKNVIEEYEVIPARVTAIYTEDVPIQVHRITEEDLEEQEAERQLEERMTREILRRWDTEEVYDETVKELLENQLTYCYPYEQEQRIKQKVSVSELKKQVLFEEDSEVAYPEEEVVPLLPKFLQKEEPLVGALRGTAYHKVMEVLDFTKEYDEEGLKQELCAMKEQGLLDEAMSECVRIQDILKFLHSNIGKRMQKAAREGKIYAEQPFVMGVDAKIIYPDSGSEEMVLIQGIIDAYFEEGEQLVVVDYKTDRVSKSAELVERYHSQLEHYAKALERLTGWEVRERIIYSFTLQEEIHV